MIYKYISRLCEILEISVPTISYDTSKFLTNTTMANYSPTSNTIYIKEKMQNNPDYLFAIAHELRHSWQVQTDEQFYFGKYRPVSEIGVECYNLQPAEIDANAFASLVLRDFFHLQALFDGMPESIKEAINKRVAIIESSLED